MAAAGITIQARALPLAAAASPIDGSENRDGGGHARAGEREMTLRQAEASRRNFSRRRPSPRGRGMRGVR